MALPANGSAWPPKEHTERYSRMRINSAWYGGDPERLKNIYGGDLHTNRTRTGLAGAISNVFGWFWGRTDTTQVDDKMHVPVAQDIATISSELLFSKTPKFTVQFTEFQADGTPNTAQEETVRKTQARLDYLLDQCGFDSTLLAAAEVSSALGSTAFKIAWDKSQRSTPVIVRVDADAVVPEYQWGQLVAVTFWSVVARDGEERWYHLERHERGLIYHGLYKGTNGNLGIQVPLTDSSRTAYLAELVDQDGAIRTVPDAQTAISIPNMLPDALDRNSNVGRSDFTPGVISLFDAIDKTYTSLMRDIDDGRSRLIVADYMLDSKGAGKGVEFDTDQHIFTKLKMQPTDRENTPITQVQFALRVQEHIAAIELLTSKAIKAAGYSPQSMGDYEAGTAITATEVEAREGRSLSTRMKKLRYWQNIEQLLESLLKIDAEYFESGITPLPVKMEVPPPAEDSLKVLAETVEVMKRAEASSLRVRVSVLHPDWDDSEIDAEIERIQNESSVVDPLTFGMGGSGLSLTA
jgi:hypothetical protein